MIRPNYVLAAMGALFLSLILIVSGVIPIQASSGHWRATAWLLDLIKRRSVTTYSLTIVPPPLDQPSWIVRGAAHFETGCRPCHGSPLSPRPPFVLRMTPQPPELHDRIARWKARHLFQIVKHGIKFTAMPAWAAPQRADEIWAIVAFLQMLPSLNQGSYRELAFGATSTSDGVSVVERCARCHGADGMGRGGNFPVLARQRPEYLTNALLAYREGRRHSGIMRPEAFELDDQARHEVVAYFSSLPRAQRSSTVTGSAPTLVTIGQPSRDVPACSQCHGPSATDRNPAYPILDGQPADYLFEQLVLFAEHRRGGSQFGPIMQMIAARLSPDQMREAADYYSSR